MDINGIENLTLNDLEFVFKRCNEAPLKDAMPLMREFANDHMLSDEEALRAFGVAQRIFDK